MSIQGIKKLTFEQAFLKAPIPRDGSHEKYIAKDFVLELGDVKIKLKASDSLRDVVRKINLKSHVTGIRGKAAKGKLVLEATRKGRGQHMGITLPQKALGEGCPVNANQVIANYLASLPPKISTEIQAGEPIGLYVINEVDEADEVSGEDTIDELFIINEENVNDEEDSFYEDLVDLNDVQVNQNENIGNNGNAVINVLLQNNEIAGLELHQIGGELLLLNEEDNNNNAQLNLEQN